MNNSKENTAITLEGILAVIREMGAEVKAMFAESQAEFEKESVASSKRFDRKLQKSSEKFDRELQKSRAEFEQRMKTSNEAFDKQMSSLKEHMSGIVDSNGSFAEDYFFNSLDNGQINFFLDEKIDKILPNVKGRTVNDEYDIVFINGKTVGIVEVKYKARKDDIPKMLKKPNTFRANFLEYRNHKVYLALAALTINRHCQSECIKQGIAVIKPVGDTVVIKNEHLKEF